MKGNIFIKNVSYSFLGKIFAMVLLVLLDISAARILNIEDYAEWVFFFSILTMLYYIGWMGINASTKVYISKCNNITERDNCIYASFLIRSITSLGFFLILVIFIPRLAAYLGYPAKYPGLKILLQLSALLVLLNSFTEYFKELFIGMQKYKNLFLLTVCEYSGYFIFSIIILSFISKTWAVAAGYTLSGIGIFILGTFMLKHDIGFYLKNTDSGYKHFIMPILKYSFPIAVISFGSLVLVEMDTFMLGLLSTKDEVAIYNIAKTICSKAAHINYALASGTVTSFSVLTVDNIVEKRKQFIRLSRINLLITMFVVSSLLLFSTIAISILYGQEYKATSSVIHLLVPYYALYAISNLNSSFLDFRGKARFRSICYISIIVINLSLNLLLIPLYGAKGAAIATDVSLLPYTIIVTIGASRQFSEFPETPDHQ